MKNMSSFEAYHSNFNSDSSETIAYNNPLFPVYIRNGNLSYFPGYSAISHWHMDLEFVIILHGSMLYNVNGILTELSEKQAIMVNSRQLHYGFSPEKKECEFLCILFSPLLFQSNKWFYENYIQVVTENSSLPYLLLNNTTWHKQIIHSLLHITDQAEPFSVMENLYHIMQLLYSHLPVSDSPLEKNSGELFLLKKMMTYMEENYFLSLRLSDISAAGMCCQSRCCSLFRKYLNDSPISYLTKLRLRKSLHALLEGDCDITSIALNHGFGGSSYYCETFRKYYGISPLQYRKLHRQN